jgi:hypothetical protein
MEHNNTKVEIHEAKRDYVSAFRCLLVSKTPHRCLFQWVNKTISTLENNSDGGKNYTGFISVLKI